MTKSTKGLRSRLFGGQIWFPEGFRLGANGYIEALTDTLVPWMRQVLAHNRGDVPWIFQQNSAPAHRQKNKSFSKKGLIFGPLPEKWPPNSPDLNPLVDFAICQWSSNTQATLK